MDTLIFLSICVVPISPLFTQRLLRMQASFSHSEIRILKMINTFCQNKQVPYAGLA